MTTLKYNDGATDTSEPGLYGVIATRHGNLISGPLEMVLDMLSEMPGITLVPSEPTHMVIEGHEDFLTLQAMTKDASMSLILG